MILADKIIDLRKKNGWSQEELAEKLDVSRQSISKWESAQSVPDLTRVIRLAELFGRAGLKLGDHVQVRRHEGREKFRHDGEPGPLVGGIRRDAVFFAAKSLPVPEDFQFQTAFDCLGNRRQEIQIEFDPELMQRIYDIGRAMGKQRLPDIRKFLTFFNQEFEN